MVHGSPGNAGDWELLLPYAPRDAEIIPYQLPDHGAQSEDLEASVQTYERDLLEVARSAGDDLILVGCSLGAYLAARILPVLGDRIRRAVLISGFAGLPEEAVESREAAADAIERGEMSWDDVCQLIQNLFLGSTQGASERRLVEALLASTSPAMLIRGMRRLRQLTGPEARVGRFRTPTVVLHGTDDAATPLALGRDLAARGKNAELITIETDAHLLQVTHAKEVARWIFESGR